MAKKKLLDPKAVSADTRPLKGWKAIADFLGQPQTTIKRWASEGMPVRREGRYVEAEPAKLSAWLGREQGVRKPVHIAHENEDLSGDLKEALKEARKRAS